MNRRLITVLISVFSAISGWPYAEASPVELVSDATLGFSNANLGDFGAPDGQLPWFPPPNTFGGTQDEVFTSAPVFTAEQLTLLGDWLTQPETLNTNWTGPEPIPIAWTVNEERAILYVVDGGPGLTATTANFGHIDNGIHIWVNGVWKFGARDPEGRTWENIPLGRLKPGVNYIQILLEDSGGATSYLQPSIEATLLWPRLPDVDGNYRAYYDEVLDITWLADANYAQTSGHDDDGTMTWAEASSWVDALEFGGVSGWRLPNMDVNGDHVVQDCLGPVETCLDNEYGYMYYYNRVSAATPDPFINVMNTQLGYRSETALDGIEGHYIFSFGHGGSSWNWDYVPYFAWAVLDGDVGAIADSDSDGVVDNLDNCILAANGTLVPDPGGNSQLDTDGDGYGNRCDPDFNGDLIVNAADLAYMKTHFFSSDADADLTGDGIVNAADLATTKVMFFGSPGPSGLVP